MHKFELQFLEELNQEINPIFKYKTEIMNRFKSCRELYIDMWKKKVDHINFYKQALDSKDYNQFKNYIMKKITIKRNKYGTKINQMS